MRVEVHLYSVLRRYAPGDAEPVALEFEVGATVSHVLEALSIPENVGRVILVNGRHANEHTALSDGDTVTLFPPVTGG